MEWCIHVQQPIGRSPLATEHRQKHIFLHFILSSQLNSVRREGRKIKVCKVLGALELLLEVLYDVCVVH
jgi:DNA-binding winged helix-turn-helix (wHTH) protein